MEVIGWEKQFKHIFDNLEEPVIIFSEDKPMYTNDIFIKQFSDEIKKAKVSAIEPLAEKLSCWDKFTGRIQACFTCSKVRAPEPIV